MQPLPTTTTTTTSAFVDPFSIPNPPQSTNSTSSNPVNDVFGSGILVPETKTTTTSAQKNTYHDPFADLLGSDVNSPPPLPSGTLMPYSGIGGMGMGMSSNYSTSTTTTTSSTSTSFSQPTLQSTSQFDYSMLQPQNKTSNQKNTGLASNDPFANLGGNWSTTKGNNNNGKW